MGRDRKRAIFIDYQLLHKRHRAFCDSSFFYALIDTGDKNTPKAQAILLYCKQNNIRLITLWDTVSETITLLRSRHSYGGMMDFIKRVLPKVELIFPDDEIKYVTLNLVQKLGKDKELSIVDVLSYVFITGILGKDTPALSFDSDFKKLGLLVVA